MPSGHYYDYQPSVILRRPVVLVSFVNELTRAVANAAAALTGLSLALLDDRVEHRAGRSAGELIALDGLPAWRSLESDQLLAALADEASGIIAAGEGVLEKSESRARVEAGADLVYLYLSFDDARRRARAQAPRHQATLVAELAESPEAGPADFMTLFTKRRRAYESARLTIDVRQQSPSAVSAELIERLAGLD